MTAIATMVATALLFAAPDEGWVSVKTDGAVKVSTRERGGTGLMEVRAVTTLDAPADAVLEVITDVSQYPKTMPHVLKAQKLPGERHWYLQLDFPVVSDRDYAFRVETRETPTGRRVVWRPSNEAPPAPKGMVRMTTEGYWDVVPVEGNRTRITYYVFADPAGALPKFLANKGSKDSLPELMKSVEKHARARAAQ